MNSEALAVIQGLSAAFQRQTSLYEQLLALTARQRQLGGQATPDVEQVGALQEEKLALLERLSLEAAGQEEMRARWEALREQVSERDKQPLLAAAEALKQTMRAVIAEEQEVSAQLEAARRRAQEQLAELSRRKAAAQAYCRAEQENRFIDAQL